MREYFEAEMRLLQEAAQEFADKYPEQARMLNLQSLHDRDPYIERLLEGVAFLTAQIRKKIDDDVPEISESLLMQLWPHLLRPFPSVTIVQFNPRVGQLQQPCIIPQHTDLHSNVVGDKNDKIECRFRTTTKVTVNPLQINDLSIIPAKTGGSIIKITMQTDAGVTAENLNLSDLRFYLHADPALALELFFALTWNVRQVKVSFPNSPKASAIILQGQQNITPCNLDPQSSLLPQSDRSYSGFHLLHEYFLFREKYFFVKIHGLNKTNWPDQCQQFTLEIHTPYLITSDYQINPNTFRLHCAPAINLFETTSEPIRLTHRKYEYPITVNAAHKKSTMLYSVDNVVGTNTTTEKRNIYHPMHSFQHKENNGNYYYVSHKNQNAYIAFSNNNLDEESISCVITASNGHHPRLYLQEDQITNTTTNISGQINLANITRPTSMHMPPKITDYRWKLISHLALNYSTLSNVKVLQKLLENYDWSGRKENKQRIQGITGINIENINKISKGMLCQELKINLKINENNFTSQAEIYLFGLILHNFFSMYANINTLVSTHINCHPSSKEFTWQPIVGANSLL